MGVHLLICCQRQFGTDRWCSGAAVDRSGCRLASQRGMTHIIKLRPVDELTPFVVIKVAPAVPSNQAAAARLLVAAHAPVFVARTSTEISIVAREEDVADFRDSLIGAECDDGWVAYVVLGTMEFSLVGIMARVATCLAAAGVPLLAQSTFDTDYVLVKREHVTAAEAAFCVAEGIEVVRCLPVSIEDDGALLSLIHI